MNTLEPIDTLRCQAEIKAYNPWVMGGNTVQTTRCDNRPHWLAREAKPGPDGQIGEMTLCDVCRSICERKLGGAVVIQPLWDF